MRAVVSSAADTGVRRPGRLIKLAPGTLPSHPNARSPIDLSTDRIASDSDLSGECQACFSYLATVLPRRRGFASKLPTQVSSLFPGFHAPTVLAVFLHATNAVPLGQQSTGYSQWLALHPNYSATRSGRAQPTHQFNSILSAEGR